MNNRFFALIALVLAFGIFFVYVQPTWTVSITEINAAITKDNEALVAAQDYKTRQRELVAARDKIDPTSLARLSKLLPDSIDNVRVILDLTVLAERSGFTLSSIDVSANSSGSSDRDTNDDSINAVSHIKSIDLSLSGTGTYRTFQRFLEGVEKSERILDVRNLTVTGASSGVYTYQMTLRIYWLR